MSPIQIQLAMKSWILNHSLLKLTSRNIPVLPTSKIGNMYRKPFPTILNYAKVYVDTKKKRRGIFMILGYQIYFIFNKVSSV